MPEQDELYQSIGQALADSLPSDWVATEVVCSMINRASEFTCTYTDATGEEVQFALPDEVDDYFAALRALLYEPGKGAWYTAVFRLDDAGRFSVDFDYEGRPAFRLWPSDQAWRDDLAKFPRDPDLIPAWLPNPPQ
ncbi:hypothetical protein [Actinopolymorpha pittospori]|uniref:DUF600 family protein n=1 Tax=Actinopolymorpha pittospori TaxID=648752 RepID=A0A927MP16_9ACTN|nr:hypothetical protein [Actinopolymorpha pittospori]MBE1604235.1 hypothetical protein [Actinopolymorpha pittospori]